MPIVTLSLGAARAGKAASAAATAMEIPRVRMRRPPLGCGNKFDAALHRGRRYGQATAVDVSNSHFSDCADFAKKSLVFWVEFRFYDSVGFLNDLIECVGRTCAGLADKRRGMNSQFSMRDIGLAGFSPFFMQCPSFLSHQRQICEGIGHGRSNCQTLLGME